MTLNFRIQGPNSGIVIHCPSIAIKRPFLPNDYNLPLKIHENDRLIRAYKSPKRDNSFSPTGSFDRNENNGYILSLYYHKRQNMLSWYI